MLELGRKFYALDLIDQPRDVFYLEVEECLGHVTGTGTTTDLRGLIAVRKAEFARYRQMPPPADRFETHGAVYAGNSFQGKAIAAQETPQGDSLKGLGCCPGIVRGRARVITDPRNATLKMGEILVAERTDPGWIMLFPSAAGLLGGTRQFTLALGHCGPRDGHSSRRLPHWRDTLAAGRRPGGTERRHRRRRPHCQRRTRRKERRMGSEVQAKADFSGVRYAQCWEDADVLLEALDVQPGDVCLSIASAGDNALALLTRHPARVIALDLSPAQLACVELRVAAYRTLEHKELLELIGSVPSQRRLELYRRCQPLLGAAARTFWDARPADIAAGNRGLRQVRATTSACSAAMCCRWSIAVPRSTPCSKGALSTSAGTFLPPCLGHLPLATAFPRLLLAICHGPYGP